MLAALLLACAGQAHADTTIDSVEKHAWSANTGWLTFRPNRPLEPDGVVVGASFLSGFAYSANLGWINFGDGTPINGYSYSNSSGTNFGVNHDGGGNLSGLAWSASTGWVNFGWAASRDPNRPRIDLQDGAFGGYAWSANTGWINLGEGLKTNYLSRPDTDGDGLADHWELRYFRSLTRADSRSDTDGDGESDVDEYNAGTDPSDLGHYFRLVSESYRFGSRTDFVTLTFTSTPSRFYFIQHAPGAGTRWTGSALDAFAPSSGTSTRTTIEVPSGDRRVFRVGTVQPLTEPSSPR